MIRRHEESSTYQTKSGDITITNYYKEIVRYGEIVCRDLEGRVLSSDGWLTEQMAIEAVDYIESGGRAVKPTWM